MNIKKFDKDCIELNSKILVIGSEAYGSQSIARSVIYDNRNKYDRSLMLSSYDDSLNNLYSNMIPNLKVLKDNYGQSDYMGGDNIMKTELHLKDFISNQKKRIRDQIFNTSTLDFEKDRCLIILNNVGGYWLKSNIIKSLFLEAKQFNIGLIIINQYSHGLLPSMRSCIDYIFITKGQSNVNQCKLYDHYCSMFESYKEFSKMYTNNKIKYPDCLVVSQVVSHIMSPLKIEDAVFWWSPKKLNDLKFILIDE